MISTPNLYPVRLEPEQRQALEELTRNGRAPAKKMRHAQVLLLSDHHRPGGKRTDVQIADALGRHVNTVAGVRKVFVTPGEQPALERKPRLTPPVPPKIDGAVEAHIIAIRTGPPPVGRARWTMKLIAGELVRREVLTSISGEAVRRVLKKTRSSPGRSSRGASRSATTPGSSPTWNGCSTSTPPNTPRTSR
jgi:hypothetical protein